MKTSILIASAAIALGVGAFALCETKASKGDSPENPDYLLVLGCRVRGEKPEATLMLRIAKAAEYLKENESTTAICCGGIVHEDQLISEAEAMKRELLARGINESRIILEDKSKTTAENFTNAKAIINSLPHRDKMSIAVLSSDFHLMRATAIAKRQGVNAPCVAAESPDNQKLKNYLRELICFPGVYLGK